MLSNFLNILSTFSVTLLVEFCVASVEKSNFVVVALAVYKVLINYFYSLY